MINDTALLNKLDTACWIAHSLFNRSKTAGSSANLSFRHHDHIFITSSGTCFGRLTNDDFTELTLTGAVIGGRKASKEFPLHQALYLKSDSVQAVIHTHGRYSTLWSCLVHENRTDVIPEHTPYLKMKVGKIGIIPFAPPGSEELFRAFRERVNDSDGFLLANHGAIVGAESLLEAFYGLEELEESAAIAWHLRNEPFCLISSFHE